MIHHYLAAFFAGAFLANAVPHFVHGISGERFPTPFARPPGRGLSSAPLNVAWALANILIGYLLLRSGTVAGGGAAGQATVFAGAAVLSLFASVHFEGKQRPSTSG